MNIEEIINNHCLENTTEVRDYIDILNRYNLKLDILDVLRDYPSNIPSVGNQHFGYLAMLYSKLEGPVDLKDLKSVLVESAQENSAMRDLRRNYGWIFKKFGNTYMCNEKGSRYRVLLGFDPIIVISKKQQVSRKKQKEYIQWLIDNDPNFSGGYDNRITNLICTDVNKLSFDHKKPGMKWLEEGRDIPVLTEEMLFTGEWTPYFQIVTESLNDQKREDCKKEMKKNYGKECNRSCPLHDFYYHFNKKEYKPIEHWTASHYYTTDVKEWL